MKAILKSNIICVNNQNCNSLVLKYKNISNSFGFNYTEGPEDFYQQVRISAFIRSNSFDVKEKIYRRHDGTFKNTGVTIDKKYSLITDQLDENSLDALAVASKHDEFILDDKSYSAQGVPELTDNEFSNLSSAKLEIFVQGFNQSNIAC